MAYLDWNPTYKTGIAGIDYEHRRLVKMLNDIHEFIAEKVDSSNIRDVLAEFYTQASAHFALEEAIMQDENYSNLEEKRHIHHRLLDQVREIMEIYEAGGQQSVAKLPGTLKEWLLEAMAIDGKLFAEVNELDLRRWGLSWN